MRCFGRSGPTPPRPARRFVAAAVALTLPALLAGCGRESDTASTAPPSTAPPSTAPPTTFPSTASGPTGIGDGDTAVTSPPVDGLVTTTTQPPFPPPAPGEPWRVVAVSCNGLRGDRVDVGRPRAVTTEQFLTCSALNGAALPSGGSLFVVDTGADREMVRATAATANSVTLVHDRAAPECPQTMEWRGELMALLAGPPGAAAPSVEFTVNLQPCPGATSGVGAGG